MLDIRISFFSVYWSSLCISMHANIVTFMLWYLQVDIYESRSFIGGKVGSFVDKRGNHIEMGLHVFFGCYNNLFRLMKKVITASFLPNKLKQLSPHPPNFWRKFCPKHLLSSWIFSSIFFFFLANNRKIVICGYFHPFEPSVFVYHACRYIL